MWKGPIPTTTDFEICRFLQTCVPPFLKTDLAIHFAQIWTCPFDPPTQLEHEVLTKSGVPDFHQNRRGN